MAENMAEVFAPSHYSFRSRVEGTEPLEVGFSLTDGRSGPVIAAKYLYRWPRKGGVVDLQKALAVLERLQRWDDLERPASSLMDLMNPARGWTLEECLTMTALDAYLQKGDRRFLDVAVEHLRVVLRDAEKDA